MEYMKIKEEFRLLQLGPWILYRPDPGTYIWVMDEEYKDQLQGQDNFIIMTGVTNVTEAIETLTSAMTIE